MIVIIIYLSLFSANFTLIRFNHTRFSTIKARA